MEGSRGEHYQVVFSALRSYGTSKATQGINHTYCSISVGGRTVQSLVRVWKYEKRGVTCFFR